MKQVINLDNKRKFFEKLNERERRQYAAIEAQSLGYGGQSEVLRAFDSSLTTIHKGLKELDEEQELTSMCIRKAGGGRKKTLENPETAQKLQSVISDYEAGIPTDSEVRWVGLSPAKIQRKMQVLGEDISYYTASCFLKTMGYRKRRYSKDQCLSEPANRDAQFNKIATLKKVFAVEGLPVLSIDTKQKEMLGNFDRGKSYYGKDPQRH